jgi:3-oxoacyl-[acyl-carrier-protein] synthase III
VTLDSVCSTGTSVFDYARLLVGSGAVQGVLAFVNGDYEGSNVLDKAETGKSNGNAFFGSAAACTWISRAKVYGHNIFPPVFHSDGGNAYVIQIVPDKRNIILKLPPKAQLGCFAMDSEAVQKAVKAHLPGFLGRMLAAYGLEQGDLKHFKYFFPHTGNISMLYEAFGAYGYPLSRVCWGGTYDGNVDAASFLKDIAKVHELGLIDSGDLLGAVVYGGGFQMGAWGFVSEARAPLPLRQSYPLELPPFPSVDLFKQQLPELKAILEREYQENLVAEARDSFDIDP